MSWSDTRAQMRRALGTWNQAAPDVASGFTVLSKAAKAEGALDLRTKELIAIAIAVADRCEPCIMFHIDALSAAGGSREELVDALGMCVQMGGGPSVMYSAKALECWDELAA